MTILTFVRIINQFNSAVNTQIFLRHLRCLTIFLTIILNHTIMCQPTPYVGQVGTRVEVRKTSLCLDSFLKLFVLYIFFA
jgi:hypothetical protein